jgi:glycyl-tRNA synthetase beta chain/uncharacterized protein
MYPLGPRPTSREGWVLVLADKAASMGDFTQYMRGLVNGSSRQNRRRLETTDPFFRDHLRRNPRRPLLRNRTRLLRRRLADKP